MGKHSVAAERVGEGVAPSARAALAIEWEAKTAACLEVAKAAAVAWLAEVA